MANKMRKLIFVFLFVITPPLLAGPQENFLAAMKRNNLKQAQKLFAAGGIDLNVADDKGKNAVMYACGNGNAAAFLWLAENNADIKTQDSEGNNCLHLALNVRKPAPLFAAAIEKGLDKNARNSLGETPFLKAAATGKKPAFDALLQSGVDINATDKDNLTPLLRAISGRQYALAQALVTAGANTNAGSMSALVMAFNANQFKLFEALVKAGANTGVEHDKSGRVLLLEAVKKERIAFAKLLIESGASLNIADEKGDSLPVVCVKQVVPDLIAPLLARGISIDTKDASGKTLFLLAHENILKRHTAARAKLYKILLENGANPNTISSAARSVLMEQSENGRTTEVALLLAQGANVNFRDKSNNTVLHSTALRNQLGSMRVILEKFPDVNIVGDSGNTAAHFSARMGGTGILKLLTGRGANLEIKNSDAETPLSIAISRQDVQTTKALLSMGAVLSDTGRETPLMLEIAKSGTATARTRELLATLTKAGASIDATNSYGNNALSYALSRKNMQMAQAFLAAGAKSEAGDARGNTLLHKLALGSLYNKLKNQELTDWINLTLSYEHPDYQNVQGQTALHVVANSENNPDLEAGFQFYETLVNYSASVQIADKQGNTAYKLGKKMDWDILAAANLPAAQPSVSIAQNLTTPENDVLVGFVAGGENFFAAHRYGKLTRLVSFSEALKLKRELDLGTIEAMAPTDGGVLVAGVKLGAIDGVVDNKCRKDQNWVVYVAHLNANLGTRWEYTWGKTGSCQRTHAVALGFGAQSETLVYAEFSGRRSVLKLNSNGSPASTEISRSDRVSELFPLSDNRVALVSQNTVYNLETGKTVGRLTKTRGFRQMALSEKGDHLLASDFTKLAGRRGVSLSLEDGESKPIWTKNFAGEANMTIERVLAQKGRYCALGKTDGALHGQAHSSPGKMTNYYVFCTNAQGQRLFSRLLPAEGLSLQEARINSDGAVALVFKGGGRKNTDLIFALVDKNGNVLR